MEKALLNLTPKRFLCPYCGEWHDWSNSPDSMHLGYYTASNPYSNTCHHASYTGSSRKISFYFEDDYCVFQTEANCDRAYLCLDDEIAISDIVESIDEPKVTFTVHFTTEGRIGSEICSDCNNISSCQMVRLAEKSDQRHIDINFGFEFEQSDYDKLVKSKEDTIMAKAAKTKKTSIKTQLYEKSPKENIEIVKAWAENYKPVLRWAIPVATVYGAYRILNSQEFDLSVNNISEICEKKLGFKLELLENKRALKELMVIGGLSAGAYGAVKAVSSIFGTQKEKDISVEEVEAGMNQLEAVSKKFAWIQPKTEDMLPIAFSVILVYVTLHNPKFTGKAAKKVRNLIEDFQVKIDTYIALVKLFIQDKFNIDLSSEEEQKKLKICAFLVVLMGVFAFLYGKKVLGDKTTPEETGEDKEEDISKSVETFIEQAKAIIKKIAPTVYTSLITLLVSKKILMLEEEMELSEEKEKPNTVADEAAAPEEKSANSNEENAELETPVETPSENPLEE